MSSPFFTRLTRLNSAFVIIRERVSQLWQQSRRAEAISWIREGTEVHGSVAAIQGSTVLVEGILNGDILGAASVYIAESGRVTGSIRAQEAIVAGEIHGDVFATSRCEVHATGLIVGSVHASACLLIEGARVAGAFRIGDVGQHVAASDAALDMSEPARRRKTALGTVATREYRVVLEQ
jgi:cytoskeletal protein CcmA (bactofilin family)